MKTFNDEFAEAVRETGAIDITESPDAYYRFAVFSANIGLMLPDIPVGEHIPLFRKTLLSQRLAILEERYADRLDPGWESGGGLDFDALRSSPSIVCTFHTGSYRLLGHLLVQQGLSVSLVLSSTVVREQGGGMLALAASIGAGSGATLQLIEAEQPSSGLRILKALKQRRVVLAYLDGNTGVLANGENANLRAIRFLAGSLRVRVGVAHLAQRAGATIHSVIGLRDEHLRIRMHCNRVIVPSPRRADLEAAAGVINRLYADLAHVVGHRPWLWENWFYLQENFERWG